MRRRCVFGTRHFRVTDYMPDLARGAPSRGRVVPLAGLEPRQIIDAGALCLFRLLLHA